MRVKLIAVVAGVVVLVAAYLIGYWPQRNQRVTAEARAETLQTTLALPGHGSVPASCSVES